ncbi:histidine phosphatase family protein [Arsenicicoccus dermatophilus]|uniref:histidine phosphatase family protein n=1 Tax=Arsenicicoccus dermatophilus TaxID=1076331 RepID=UPI001F4C9D62|nr:histidine phosphatase family protein [Arsenicicoccus dermatophilus]MCH8612833.1 histidine phosphatase family protein [Arsenicicoccus dermatophilus]
MNARRHEDGTLRRLVLVRHAESTDNDLCARTGARVGRVPDPLLSRYGEKQAELLAAALRLPGAWCDERTGQAGRAARRTSRLLG